MVRCVVSLQPRPCHFSPISPSLRIPCLCVEFSDSFPPLIFLYLPSSVPSSKFRIPQLLCLPLLRKLPGCIPTNSQNGTSRTVRNLRPPYLPRQNGGTISFRSLRQRWYLEMMTVKTCSALIFSLSTLFAAQEASAPVPVENEPLHHVVLKNESVVVIHLTLPPGERTLYHTHSHDRIAVPLSSTSITQQVWNEQEGAPSPTEPGTFSALTLVGTSYTHRVHNVGANPYDVLDIELLVRPQSPSPATVAPVAAENPSARIYTWVLAPGARSALHTHGKCARWDFPRQQ